MGARIVGAIGAAEPLERLWRAAGGAAAPLDLPQGLRILALTEARLDALTRLEPGAYAEGFVYLSEVLEAALRAASAGGAVAYLESEAFGGRGRQAAALFAGGLGLWREGTPLRAAKPDPQGPANRALRALGVRAAAGEDEFAALGLERLRNFGVTE